MASVRPHPEVTAWILAGGEGRRMGGLDKGLALHRDTPLAQCAVDRLRPQVAALHLNANRNLPAYAALKGHDHVWPDDADVQSSIGPLAGILTGLRRTASDWLMVAACDTPSLPADLVEVLHASALAAGADIAVPVTVDGASGETWHHWTCVLVHRRTLPSLEAAVLRHGERRVSRWVQAQAWIGVSFGDPEAFMNINTPETLRGQA